MTYSHKGYKIDKVINITEFAPEWLLYTIQTYQTP